MLSNEEKIDLFDDLDTEINKCSICPLSDDCNPILGFGSLKSNVLFVRDYPEFEESRTNNVWASPTARIFNKILHAAHINSNKIYTTYLVHCRPLNNKIISDDIKKCSSYLEKIIQIIEPKIIVTCGRLSLHYFLGNTKNICNCRGSFFNRTYNAENILIYPLNHPTSMIKIPTTKKKEMFDDLNLLFSKMIELGIIIE